MASVGDTVIDVCANLGAMTIPLARALGADGCVIAVEPVPYHARLLDSNLALNKLSNVEVHRVGCGAGPGRARIEPFDPNAPGNFGQIILRPDVSDPPIGGAAVPDQEPDSIVSVVPLDTIVSPQSEVRLIKIDAEGMESEILEGAAALLSRCRPILYLENDRQDQSAALLDRLRALDYATWWHLPPLFRPNNFFGETRNLFPQLVSVNVLAVPHESRIRIEGFQPARAEDPHPLAGSRGLTAEI